MLEMISFNKQLFRYRAESTEVGIIYNLRYGDIFVLKGKTKILIENLIALKGMHINVENEAIKYLIKQNILIKETGEVDL